MLMLDDAENTKSVSGAGFVDGDLEGDAGRIV